MVVRFGPVAQMLTEPSRKVSSIEYALETISLPVGNQTVVEKTRGRAGGIYMAQSLTAFEMQIDQSASRNR
jgi:hypothetical protein